jgi:hypothetical protein
MPYIPVATVTGASSGSLVKLDTQVLGVDTASFDFTNISGGYAHLLVMLVARSSLNAAGDDLLIRLNSDSGANYYWEVLAGTGTTVSSAGTAAATSGRVCSPPADTATAGRAGPSALWIYDYAGTTFHKTYRSSDAFSTSTTTVTQSVRDHAGVWANTSAITQVTLFFAASNLRAGSRADLYGLT